MKHNMSVTRTNDVSKRKEEEKERKKVATLKLKILHQTFIHPLLIIIQKFFGRDTINTLTHIIHNFCDIFHTANYVFTSFILYKNEAFSLFFCKKKLCVSRFSRSNGTKKTSKLILEHTQKCIRTSTYEFVVYGIRSCIHLCICVRLCVHTK